MPRFKIYLTFLILCPLSTYYNAFSQNSPYSLYGIGDLYSVTNNASASMGGISSGYRSPYHINYVNPASYAAFDTLSFIFEGGLLSTSVNQKTSSASQQNNNTSLSNLLFGFPITKWCKASIGLIPLSQASYSIVNKTVEGDIDAEMQYEGDGGLNTFYAGFGFSVTKNLSAGINVSYLFGTGNKSRAIIFNDSVPYKLNYRIIDATTYSDIKLDFGLQYLQKISKDLNLVAGVTFSNGSNVNASRKHLEETYTMGSTGVIYVKDINMLKEAEKGSVFIPLSYGIGLNLVRNNKWMVGFDYRFQQWEKYKYYGVGDSLKNSYDIALGGEYSPGFSGIKSYVKKMTYRAGFRYGKTYLQLKNNQLDEYAVSLGLGFPLSKIRSTVNVGIEFGKRGTTSDNLIQENFFKINLGVSICERWFIRRRFE